MREEDNALLAFVKERIGNKNSHCSISFFADLENEWVALGFATARMAGSMSDRHYRTRKKGGKLAYYEQPKPGRHGNAWLPKEEQALRDFMKELMGNELANFG